MMLSMPITTRLNQSWSLTAMIEGVEGGVGDETRWWHGR